MPQSFKNDYPHTRVIIDCTELFIETPSQPRTQSATFSTYKNHNTGKGLIGISQGDLTFVSEMYAGNTSDKQLTNDCGIMKLLEPGDEVMVNRAFAIEENLPPGVSFNIPPFLGDQQHSLKKMRLKPGELPNRDTFRKSYSENQEFQDSQNMTYRYQWQ